MLSNVPAKKQIKQIKAGYIDGAFCCGYNSKMRSWLGRCNFKTAAFYYHRLRVLICLATENVSLRKYLLWHTFV
jgi:hypothetical protein